MCLLLTVLSLMDRLLVIKYYKVDKKNQVYNIRDIVRCSAAGLWLRSLRAAAASTNNTVLTVSCRSRSSRPTEHS